MKYAAILLTLSATALALAKPPARLVGEASSGTVEAEALAARSVGDGCYYWDSATYGTIHGSCQNTGTCNADWGYYVSNHCPNDPVNVKCCIPFYDCADGKGGTGFCMNTSGSACGNANGHFVSNRCPGPTGVKCCIIPVTPV